MALAYLSRGDYRLVYATTTTTTTTTSHSSVKGPGDRPIGTGEALRRVTKKRFKDMT